MSIKVVQRMIHDCNELLASLTLNNQGKITKWLKELEDENEESLSIAKEYNIKHLLSLHGMIAGEIDKIKDNLLNNYKKCIGFVETILEALESVIDQREVRDQIIKEVIHPLLKSWGYKKKKRTFVKEENGYFKKLMVYTSQFCDYYDVRFIFEIYIEGKGARYEYHRVKEKWFELTEDKNIEKIKAEVKIHLLNDIKPFLDRF